jgi:Fic family protein
MATPAEKLAESLKILQVLQDKNIVAIKSEDLSRTHRDRLTANGFIREVIRGWYIAVNPEESKGNSTSWFTSYWAFCSRFLEDRYGEDYCVSAEQSLLLHSGNEVVPSQMIIRSIKGKNNSTPLLFNTSLFSMKSPLSELESVEVKNGLRILSLPASIIYSSPSIYVSNPIDVRTSLSMINDASEILGLLLDGGHSLKAGRIVGAFRNIGNSKIADEILKTMKSAGYDVRETDPFENVTPILLSSRERSPYCNRIRLMWFEMREEIIRFFPKPTNINSIDKVTFLKNIEDIYVTDAYHSLSIEKYKVTPELIERVKSGNWNSADNEEDKKHRDAMAARGYWLAFNSVKNSIEKIIDGGDLGKVLSEEHSNWFRELFSPSVTSGILKPSDLAGYRRHQVYIGQSQHVPVNVDAVRDVMPVLFELISEEPEASVRAVLGHFIFVYIHPYMDGNGRMGRFLMNALLTSGGYQWMVIPVQQRDDYMNALEMASVQQNIVPFAKFIAHLVKSTMEGNPVAEL